MADNKQFAQPAVLKFDGFYDHWLLLMENLLRSKEYWNIVENGIPALNAAATAEEIKAVEEAKLKDLKAKNYLFQSLERNILETILKKDTAKEIWDSMKQKFQGSTKVKRAQLQALRKEFEMITMKDGELVNDYFARVLSIVNKMKQHGENLQESVVVEKILRSMTSNFNYVVCSIEQANDVTTISIDELQSNILVQEQRMRGQKEEEQALKVSYDNKGSARGRGRGARGGRGRGRQSKETVECYKCKKLGHYQYECLDWGENANFAGFNDEEEVLLMTYHGSSSM